MCRGMASEAQMQQDSRDEADSYPQANQRVENALCRQQRQLQERLHVSRSQGAPGAIIHWGREGVPPTAPTFSLLDAL